MKRWRNMLAVSLCLLAAGIVFNTAVAWHAVATVKPQAGSPFLLTLPISQFEFVLSGAQIQYADEAPSFHIPLRGDETVGFAIATYSTRCRAVQESSGYSEMPDGEPPNIAWTLAAGWPLPALRIAGQDGPRSRPTMPPLSRGLVAPMFLQDRLKLTRGRLPIDPLPGFAINTLVYAVVVAATFALPLGVIPLRRRLRARRGRCPKCGYDLAGLGGADPCPECGRCRPH